MNKNREPLLKTQSLPSAVGNGIPNSPIVAPAAVTNTPQAAVQLGGAAGLPVSATVGGQSLEHLSSSLVENPQNLLGTKGNLSAQVQTIDGNASGTILGGNVALGDAGALEQTTQTGGAAATVNTATPSGATTYNAATTAGQVSDPSNQVTAAQTTVSKNSLVTDEQIDIEAVGAGQGALGQAVGAYASQNILNVIDTSTLAGKMLAQKLGEGNYTDSKATVVGQLEILTAEFTDAKTGEPKIPPWAAGVARSVSKIASFKGITGTAATGALAQALIESTIQIAQSDASFFQTTTLQNLSNRQQSTINKANVLANINLANMDARTEAAVVNAKTFFEANMTNLDNEQQARLVNSQARVQAILEDANAENVARRFGAESENDLDKFYHNLNASIGQFNAAQTNSMKQFNASETNSMGQFNAQLENAREQFYKNMQYEVDKSNVQWRQNVTLNDSSQRFEAAATDVQNLLGVSTEELNRLWDRSDSILDFAWQSGENSTDRAHQLEVTRLQGKQALEQIEAKKPKSGGFLGVLGKVAGSVLGSIAGPIGAKIGGAIGGLAADAITGSSAPVDPVT